jgi:hypothetical protein
MSSDRPFSRPATAFIVLMTGLALAAIGYIVIRLLQPHQDEWNLIPPSEQCVVTANGVSKSVTLEQAGNAAIIVAESIRRRLPARAASIALVTAWQESGLRNLDYGDRDSVGLFQQRPSMGWGTVEQIMDPWYASGKFYDALVKVADWDTADINDVAQAVQRSGVPDGYRKHEAYGRGWASALTGNSTAAISCVDRSEAAADPAVLVAFLERAFKDDIQVTATDNTVAVEAWDSTTAWAVASLALAHTGQAGVTDVLVGDQVWHHNPDAIASWGPSNAPIAASQVVITLRD